MEKKKIEVDLRKIDGYYPKLMFWGGLTPTGADPDFVVLFTAPGCGVVISAGSDLFNKVGHYSSDWCSDGWVPFGGNIKIKA